ncbi:MAG: tyrosine-type recombinase/integrase [Candidatus Marinimicrobia bacterium]|jgi:site-specific recombinase XerD|nr:tyrosine-type recombinase/integrase [Candidatus Neomarinimicrobiota bacterium]MBT4132481.1 tyrosine-type recombinase/integrase [Candidatus Neomarinimicrobiota bacterium]MBT4419160.1 tyrosine-type recombinase/integrase [Candidatus Neomarinimicrobiota bacterium]MBT6218011.1 tyrosine-type recombinase/integrase [Candidatus Neomarinimicrobiota bacterium]
MASLVKKRNKYYVRIRLPGGREKTIATGTGNLREAERRLRLIQDKEVLFKAKIIAEAELEDLALDNAITRFIEAKKKGGLRPKTISTYETAFDSLKAVNSPSMLVSSLQKSHLTRMVDHIKSNKLSDGTANIRIRSVNAFTSWLLNEGYILTPVKLQQIKMDEPLPKFLTPDELDKFYEKVKTPKLLSTFKTYEGLGLRLRELHHSRLEGDYVIIPAEHAKSRRDRMVPIPEDLKEHYIAATTNPLRPDSITHAFRRIADNAEISPGKTLHSLRHTYALRMLVQTNNIVFVKELLGHSEIETTMIYTKFPPSFLVEQLKVKPKAEVPPTVVGEA